MHIDFATYHGYDALTGHLHALAAAHPGLASLRSLATTHRGRDVWLMEITDQATGPGHEKTGYYLEAQIHAEEHATSAVALYVIHHLLTRASEPELAALLRSTCFYILPRVNPDGAELALQPPFPPWCGNGRYLPGEEKPTGLDPGDVDGDGFVTTMRVPDPKGEWKQDPAEPRLMIQREPGEEGGSYFRLYPEGRIRDFDGLHVDIPRPDDGNLNRNFPANWRPEEYGAGEFPFSEPESRAIGRLLLDHPNIAGVMSYHTHGGIILRPSMTKADAAMSPRDLALFKDLGEVGTRLTGYPTISTYEDFTPDKSKPRFGSLKDWTYERMGIPSFSTELWDLETEAGAPKTAYYNLRPRTPAIAAKVFAWVLENVGERGFRPWRKVTHPELGEVEIGGMVYTWTYRNPPGRMLPSICERNCAFVLRHAAAAPRIALDEVTAEALGAGLFRIRAVVSNHGYLPTNLTDVAVANGVARPVSASIATRNGAALVMNPDAVELGHLAGRNERKYTWSPWGQPWSPVTKAVEWLVRGPGDVEVVARSEKGGTARRVVALS